MEELDLKIYQEVKTPDGKGILISVNTPANGIGPDISSAKCTVYYGMGTPQNGKVSWEFPLNEIIKLNKK